MCEVLRPLLFSDRAKIGHNVKFDLQSLAKYYGDVIPPGPYHDTIILRHSLSEDLDSYTLKDLICEWFGIHWKKRAPPSTPTSASRASRTSASMRSPATWPRTCATAG